MIAGDPAELEVLETAGMNAVLLLPLVFEGATIALLAALARVMPAPRRTRTPDPRPPHRA